MSALNYAAGLLLFRRGLGFGMPAAVAGASLVAFGAPRLNQMHHQQLLPFFYALLALYALSRLATDLSMGRRARAGYWLLAMAAMVAQLYTAVYLAWFLLLDWDWPRSWRWPCRRAERCCSRSSGATRGRSRRPARLACCCCNHSSLIISGQLARCGQSISSCCGSFIPAYGHGSMWARRIGSGAGRPTGADPRTGICGRRASPGNWFLDVDRVCGGALPGPEPADLPARRGGGVHPLACDDLHARQPVGDAGGHDQLVTAPPVCSTRSSDRVCAGSGWRS